MLVLIGFIYRKIIDLRNRMYDRGILESFDLDTWTIGVGNLTAGGTGKTPLVAYIAQVLANRGEKVCILTRGYGRKNPGGRVLVSDGTQILADARTAGDEPLELAQKLLGSALVVADRDRLSAGEWAKRKFGITAFVLDDAFQHRRVKRDVDIVCIDAADPFGNGRMLPAGQLREPIENLRRADIVLITRSNLVDSIQGLRADILDQKAEIPTFSASNRLVRIVDLNRFRSKGKGRKLSEINQKVFAFCGIGKPESFFEQLRQEGIELAGTSSFADHHRYSQRDISALESETLALGARHLLTTSKDAVKLAGLTFTLPCLVFEIEMAIDDADRFETMISAS